MEPRPPSTGVWSRREVIDEPATRELRDDLERSGLLEQARCAGHDLEPMLAAQVAGRLPIELDHDIVPATDDQQGRGADLPETLPSEVGTPPRDTTARTGDPGAAAAHSAAPAPVLAPK
jgi:hypothetical protein